MIHAAAPASFLARVEQLIPTARALVAARTVDNQDINVFEHIAAVEPPACDDEDVAQLVRWSDAIYEFGVAVGLVLNASVADTKNGGGR